MKCHVFLWFSVYTSLLSFMTGHSTSVLVHCSCFGFRLSLSPSIVAKRSPISATAQHLSYFDLSLCLSLLVYNLLYNILYTMHSVVLRYIVFN